MTQRENPNIESPVYDQQDLPDAERAKEIPGGDPRADLHADPDAGEIAADAIAANAPPWRVAKSLLRLREQVNSRAPGRSKDSDGTIGDVHHRARTSDHNPWVLDDAIGVVTAMDITHDPAHGCDAGALASAITNGRDVRVKYVIWNRRIANSLPMGGSPAWAWRPYNGSNPHNKHVHISVKSDKGSYDATADWMI